MVLYYYTTEPTLSWNLIDIVYFSLSKRTCNGKEWSGTAPKCIPVDCGDIDVKLPLVADYIKTLYGYKVSGTNHVIYPYTM